MAQAVRRQVGHIPAQQRAKEDLAHDLIAYFLLSKLRA
jgi:hypothetical protein